VGLVGNGKRLPTYGMPSGVAGSQASPVFSQCPETPVLLNTRKHVMSSIRNPNGLSRLPNVDG
jgi:hypothetical protein